MPVDRFLVVGLGSIGVRHARVLRHLRPEARIAALRSRPCGDALPDGIDDCFGSVEAAAVFGAQAAVVASPSPFHLETSLALARAGVHLLIEKPLSTSTTHVEDLLRVCREHGRVLTVGYNLRFSPSLQYFRDVLRARGVGRVLSVRAEVGQYLPSWRPASDYRRSVSARASLGGGVLLELSHELDYLQWLFGAVQWVSATSLRQSDLDIDVEDTVHVTLGFEKSGSSAPVVAQLNMDFVRHDTVRSCTVIGELGTLRWNAVTGVVERFDPGAREWVLMFSCATDRDEGYRSEWEAFLRAIEEGAPVAVTGEDAHQVLRVIEAARESASSHQTVRLSVGADQ